MKPRTVVATLRATGANADPALHVLRDLPGVGAEMSAEQAAVPWAKSAHITTRCNSTVLIG